MRSNTEIQSHIHSRSNDVSVLIFARNNNRKGLVTPFEMTRNISLSRHHSIPMTDVCGEFGRDVLHGVGRCPTNSQTDMSPLYSQVYRDDFVSSTCGVEDSRTVWICCLSQGQWTVK